MRNFGFPIVVAISSIVAAQPALACQFDVKNNTGKPIAIYGVLAQSGQWAIWHSRGWRIGVGEKQTINVGPRFEDIWCNSVTIAFDEADSQSKSVFLNSYPEFYQAPGLPFMMTLEYTALIATLRTEPTGKCIENAYICD